MEKTITKFNTNHARIQASKIAGKNVTTWSDGMYIIIHAGDGPEGEQLAQKIIDACQLPAIADRAQVLCSIAEHAQRQKENRDYQTFVSISRDMQTMEHWKQLRQNIRPF